MGSDGADVVARVRIAVHLTHPRVEAWNFTPAHADRLRAAFPEAVVTRCASADAFAAALTEADGGIAWRFEQGWLDAAPSLRWIATPAAGRDYFRVTPPAGVDVYYGAFQGELIAETVVGAMLGFRRGLFDAIALAEAEWPRGELSRRMGTLRGDHVVILGFGSIGRWIGKLVKPFGARITGIRRRSDSPPPDYFDGDDRQRPPEEVDAVLPDADHLVLALPDAPSTRRILDATRLARLRSSAYVYNVGRGTAIDESALADALEGERLAGAALDVYEVEPLPADSRLRRCPRLLRLPHASAIAPNYLDLFVDEFAARFRG